MGVLGTGALMKTLTGFSGQYFYTKHGVQLASRPGRRSGKSGLGNTVCMRNSSYYPEYS